MKNYPAVGQAVSVKWLLALAILFLVSVIERIYGIDRQSLWSDELYAVVASYKPWLGAWRDMVADSHPPGYLTFMYFTLPWTGYSEFGVRLHALLFGLAWIPLVFVLCRRWFGVNAALIAVAVVASGYNAVYYSQEARAYSMLIAFNILNVACFLELLFSAQCTRWHRVGFIVSATAMLYLHYSGFVFLCAEILLCGLLWLTRFRINLKELCIIFGVPFLLYAPWLGVMYNNLVDAPRNWAVSSVPTVQEVYFVMQRLLAPDDAHMRFHCMALLLAFIFAIGLRIKHGSSRQLTVVFSLLWLLVVPILAFYVESLLATPIFEKRYFLMAIVIEAVLLGWLSSRVLAWSGEYWSDKLTLMAVAWFTVWTINANVSFGLYSKLDKDPVREAVGIIKDDIKKNTQDQPYAVIMSHAWFEPYFRWLKIDFDQQWPLHLYFVTQQFDGVLRYMDEHRDKVFLYYIALREPNAQAALVPLKLQYRLVSQAEAAIEAGTIDVYKFNLHEQPDDEQLKSAGSNRSNDIARSVAQDIGSKDPSTYHVLFTHDWIQPYLRRNGVTLDKNLDNHRYVVNAQASSVYQYIEQHPSIDTLYYLALQEPNAEGAELLLQLRYRLVSETTTETAVGNMSVLKFLVKEPPIIDDAAEQRMRATPAYQVVANMQEFLQQKPQGTVAVATANTWIELYLQLGGIPIDETWSGRRCRFAADVPNVRRYIEQHPKVETLYYVALRSEAAEAAVQALRQVYTPVTQTSVDVAVGTVDIFQFAVKGRP